MYQVINPLDPKFPIHEIELEHMQARFVTKFGGNKIVKIGLEVEGANQYILALLKQQRYHLDQVIIIRIRMHWDRIELRFPLSLGQAYVYSENIIQQLLLQWLLQDWQSLSRLTLNEIFEMNSIGVSEYTEQTLPKQSTKSTKFHLDTRFKGQSHPEGQSS